MNTGWLLTFELTRPERPAVEGRVLSEGLGVTPAYLLRCCDLCWRVGSEGLSRPFGAAAPAAIEVFAQTSRVRLKRKSAAALQAMGIEVERLYDAVLAPGPLYDIEVVVPPINMPALMTERAVQRPLVS